MTKKRRCSNPARRLHTIRPARWKFQMVPARTPANSKAVDTKRAQLAAEESTAYGLVARMISFPVLMRDATASERANNIANSARVGQCFLFIQLIEKKY